MPGFAALRSDHHRVVWSPRSADSGWCFSKIDALRNPWINVPLSAVGGFHRRRPLVLVLFRAVFRRTQSSSEAKVAKLIGITATIITPIPENGRRRNRLRERRLALHCPGAQHRRQTHRQRCRRQNRAHRRSQYYVEAA
jgi:hypothetical protein